MKIPGFTRESRALLLFPPFRLDTANEELWRDAQQLTLRPKTFAVLSYLARNPQRLVTKRELLSNVWARVAVNEELLRGYVRELRLALGDDARAPRYLITVPGRGYKFVPRVTEQPNQDSEAFPVSTTLPRLLRAPDLLADSRTTPERRPEDELGLSTV